MIDLFQPFQIGKLEINNRFVRSATWDGTANPDGTVSEESVTLYETMGKAGIGLIVTGFAYVNASGQAGSGQYGIHNDAMIPGLKRLADAVHRHGGKIAVQIHHGGNITQRNIEQVFVVSENPADRRKQNVMSEADIESLIGDFTAAALRVKEAGCDAVQLHGAHGYLMSQFLSPLSNHRTDRWGGSIENRSRFHTEVIRRIRRAVGDDFPVLIKFGVMDESDEGLSIDEGVNTAVRMCRAGIDAIEVSAGISTRGWGSVPVMKPGATEFAFFRERARAVKRAVDVPVILVGGIRSLSLATEIVNSGDADMISISRPFIREPGLLKRWQQNKDGADCVSCNRCFPPRITDGQLVVCRKKEQAGN